MIKSTITTKEKLNKGLIENIKNPDLIAEVDGRSPNVDGIL